MAKNPPTWSIEYDRGFRKRITERRQGGWDLTLTPGKILSLIFREDGERPYNRIPANGQIRLRMQIQQSPDVEWDVDPLGLAPEEAPPRICLVVKSSMSGVSNRFYCTTRADINQNGIVEIIAPIDPTHWKNVNGKLANSKRHILNKWREVMTHPYSEIGIGFGAFFFSKGLGIKRGSAKISLLSMRK